MGHKVTKQDVNDSVIGLLQRRHLLVGWAGLLVFLSLGISLEAFHGFKTGAYLDTHNSARRLMWTLCHAHGTLFSLVHIAFACSLGVLENAVLRSSRFVSWCLIGAIVVMPLGFFLGGCQIYGGDPGIGVFIVPIGALLLLMAVWTFLLTLLRSDGVRRKPGTAPAPNSGQAPSGRKKKRS